MGQDRPKQSTLFSRPPLVRAVWSDLIIVSFAVPDHLLLPYLALGQCLDRWQGEAYVSLVAFHFGRVRLRGWPLPGPLGNFPQWNLRFYVRPAHGEMERREAENERGVVFIREFVPHPLVAGAVRLLYHEPYRAAPLSCRATPLGQMRRVRYDLWVAGRRHTLAVTARAPARPPRPGTAGAFLTQPGWGCGRNRAGARMQFAVTHPTWRNYQVEEVFISVDFGRLYGRRWEWLNHCRPASVLLCAGSAVGVSAAVPASG